MFQVRDLGQHVGEVPGHPVGVQREGLLLRRGAQGVLFRQGPGNISTHTELLPHWKAAFSQTGMFCIFYIWILTFKVSGQSV